MEVPNDECQPFLRMDEFSSIPPYAMPQPMQPVTPMPWESYGIMVNPFQNPMNPMQMMRQVYQQPPQSQSVPSPAAVPVPPAVQPAVPPAVQPMVQSMLQHVQPVQLRHVSLDAAKSSPQGPDAVRNKFRDSLIDALKMVALEQTKDELTAFLDAAKLETAEAAAPPAPLIQALAEVQSPVVRKPRSKPNKRMKLEVSFEDRVAEHAKVAAKSIELELLRMFRAVDRKYREKARSLAFNLKDKNNPELRFRVFVGEISPQGLCSMTIEELASKELSQWRIAKAEERAQMVVITDEDVNPSKLVKKTHKGEIIMEVDNEALDVPSVSSADAAEDDAGEPEIESDEQENTGEQTGEPTEEPTEQPTEQQTEQNDSGEELATEVTEGTPTSDPVAEDSPATDTAAAAGEEAGDGKNVEESSDVLLDVSDFKGLPEIMSMDGFLKTMGQGQTLDAEMREAEVISETEQPENPLKRKQPDAEAEQDSPSKGEEQLKAAAAPAAHLWDGSLQLTVTRSTAVHAVFRSGHDVKLEAWPKQLEVKGRVKLGPLAKFLKDLSLSKSRAVTAVSFYSSDMATSSLSLLKEVVDQYEKGERVGYVEPGTGYELYLFPPGKPTWKFLTDNGRLKPGAESGIPKERSEVLVGCIVWRKKASEKQQSESKRSSASTSDKSKKSSSSKSKAGSSSSSSASASASASRSKHTSSVSISPPAASAASHHYHNHHLPKSSSADIQSLSVVQQHSVNEWQQSSLVASQTDSSVAAAAAAAAVSAAPSSVLSGPEGYRPFLPGPPGFHRPVTDLDDLPEYDYEGNVPPAYASAAAASTSLGTGAGGYKFLPAAAAAGQGGFQAQYSTSATSSSSDHHVQQGSSGSEWSRGGFEEQMEYGGCQQQQMFQQKPHGGHLLGGGAPPLPPGPPPGASSYGHWVHPNQAAHQQQQQHKSLHYASSNARYRS